MVVELISVGTELLLGNITNTNARYLSEQCAMLGLSVYYQTVVGDNEARLTETVQMALGRSDCLILTGGLGPTEDDLTKEVCAKALGFSLVLVLFAGMRERIAIADVPTPFRGAAIGMITAGLMSLAFMGFTGLIRI